MSRSLVVTAPRVLAMLLGAIALPACHGPSKPARPDDPSAPTDIHALATFDPAAIGPGAPPKPGPARPLDVLDYGPSGRSEGTGEIHVRFNQPVVALELADRTGLDKLFTIDPPLPGSAYWKSPDLLVYAPNSSPAECQTYTVRFAGGVVALSGQRFDRPLTWSFETPRPTVVRSEPASQPIVDEVDDPADGSEGEVHRRDSVVLVEFDNPVAIKEAQAHIQALARPIGRAGSKLPGKPVPVRVRKPSKAERERFHGYDREDDRHLVAVQARNLWPGSSEVVLSVTPGLRSEAGPLPLDTPWSMVFRTYSAQSIVRMGCPVDDPCGLEPITLRLRNPIEESQLRKISVTPKPKFLQINSYDNWGEGGHEIVIEGQFVPETTYAVHIPASVRDIYGQSIAGGATREARIAARPTIGLSGASGILRVGEPQTIGVESRHVKAVRVRLGVLSDEEIQKLPLDGDTTAIMAVGFPGRVVERSYTLTPTGKADWSSLSLDLADLSGNARRPVLVEVSASELTPAGSKHDLPDLVRGLFRLTDLGPVATVSLPASSVQVLRLSDGAPVSGATIYRPDPNTSGKLLSLGATDRDGLLALPASLLPARDRNYPNTPSRVPTGTQALRLTVVDPAHDDHAHLDIVAPYLRDLSARDADKPTPLRPGERLIARVVSERGVYRPGEKVRVVGWSAVDTPFARSNLGRLKAGTPVVFTLKDPFSKVVATHATRTTAEGKFWAELPVPAEAALGGYSVIAELAGTSVTANVKVEDYRVPEFTVEASARRPDILAGELVAVDVHASYYFGGPVQIQRLSRRLDCDYQRYRPPGLEDIWSVGEPPPHNVRYRSNGPRVIEGIPTGSVQRTGHREIQLGNNLDQPRYPARCTASVEVQDASMQGIGAEAGFAVHPAAFYLALAAPRGYHQAGEQGLKVPMRAVAIAGPRVAVAGAELQITRSWTERSYKTEGGKQVFDRWVERSEKLGLCKQDLPAEGADPSCPLPPLKEGNYELRVHASEAGSTRVAHTVTNFHVYPKNPYRDISWRSRPIDRLEVLTDKQEVRPGDTLEVAVRGPWPGARGNLVVARGGIRDTYPVVLTDKEHIFKFTVDDTWTPGVYFQASVIQPPGPNHRQPEVERASAQVRQDFAHRRLKVAVDAPAKASPGQQVELAVRVSDEQDRPSSARVALWAVDEAVLDLTAHEIPDLLPDFIPRRDAELSARDDYSRILYPYFVVPDDPWFSPYGSLSGIGSGTGYGRGAGGGMAGRSGAAIGPPPRTQPLRDHPRVPRRPRRRRQRRGPRQGQAPRQPHHLPHHRRRLRPPRRRRLARPLRQGRHPHRRHRPAGPARRPAPPAAPRRHRRAGGDRPEQHRQRRSPQRHRQGGRKARYRGTCPEAQLTRQRQRRGRRRRPGPPHLRDQRARPRRPRVRAAGRADPERRRQADHRRPAPAPARRRRAHPHRARRRLRHRHRRPGHRDPDQDPPGRPARPRRRHDRHHLHPPRRPRGRRPRARPVPLRLRRADLVAPAPDHRARRSRPRLPARHPRHQGVHAQRRRAHPVDADRQRRLRLLARRQGGPRLRLRLRHLGAPARQARTATPSPSSPSPAPSTTSPAASTSSSSPPPPSTGATPTASASPSPSTSSPTPAATSASRPPRSTPCASACRCSPAPSC